MQMCFGIRQLLTLLKFVQILNKKSYQALWKSVFTAEGWCIYFYYAVLSRSSDLLFESFHCEINFFIFSRTLQVINNERKHWKLKT